MMDDDDLPVKDVGLAVDTGLAYRFVVDVVVVVVVVVIVVLLLLLLLLKRSQFMS